MKKKILRLLFLPAVLVIALGGCKKDEAGPTGTLTLGITDSRTTPTKNSIGILDASKLTKFEITISKVELKKQGGGTVTAMDQPVTVDLRKFQQSIKELGTVQTPIGKYSGITIYLTGITITYDGNTYTSSVGGTTSLTLGALPGMTFTSANGVPVIFSSELSVGMDFEFELTEELNNRNLNISLDVVASCGEIEFPCEPCGGAQKIAVLRDFFQVSFYFEEGIQEIRHSPPLGIELSGGSSAEYFGYHTFIDFNGIGGTINSHKSQHIYRGEDGFDYTEAEDLAVNSTTLTPNTVNATGETKVKAVEVFKFSAIKSNLAAKGVSLTAGKKYYFSLLKVWNITSGNTTYEITRLCEPVPVVWPTL